ncbi:MAG: alpha/beta hydrolase [Flexibacteraceae bacterium]
MEADSFSYGNLIMHFTRIGERHSPDGSLKPVLLLFHGFGQQEKQLFALTNQLLDTYCCYCFTLPYHGKGSRWKGSEPINKALLANWYKAFLQSINCTKASLFGFSIGARFALSLTTEVPEKVEALYLASPDGIAFQPIYSFATSTKIGRSIFKYLVFKPKLLFNIIQIAHNLKLADLPLLKFVSNQMNSRPKRWLVYQSWIQFSQLKATTIALKQTTKNYTIPIFIALAKTDKIIEKNKLAPYLNKLNLTKFLVIECSHNQLLNRCHTLFKS